MKTEKVGTSTILIRFYPTSALHTDNNCQIIVARDNFLDISSENTVVVVIDSTEG